MGGKLKSARDGVLPGSISAVVALALVEQYGWAESTAVVAGMVVAGAGAYAYRIIRHNWPWLADFDPGAVR